MEDIKKPHDNPPETAAKLVVIEHHVHIHNERESISQAEINALVDTWNRKNFYGRSW